MPPDPLNGALEHTIHRPPLMFILPPLEIFSERNPVQFTSDCARFARESSKFRTSRDMVISYYKPVSADKHLTLSLFLPWKPRLATGKQHQVGETMNSANTTD